MRVMLLFYRYYDCFGQLYTLLANNIMRVHGEILFFALWAR